MTPHRGFESGSASAYSEETFGAKENYDGNSKLTDRSLVGPVAVESLFPHQQEAHNLACLALANDVWRGLAPMQSHVVTNLGTPSSFNTPSSLNTDMPPKKSQWRQVRGLDDDFRKWSTTKERRQQSSEQKEFSGHSSPHALQILDSSLGSGKEEDQIDQQSSPSPCLLYTSPSPRD